ncbi:hypothetical protein [Kineosporia sp. A_224]|uniref:hypothetical protein n=1 Tax=Kineosporia sp. A_224 TaxID=1962180 RepID=UPI000B4BF601|nr:hypothetical protein [Kineosporia sp. A_224]
MTDPSTAPQDGAPDATAATDGARGRRAVLAAGAGAALGAFGVAVAQPAEAAAGAAMLIGRSNWASTSGTTLSSTTTGTTLWCKATVGNGLLGDTTSSARWGAYGRNLSGVTGSAGALRGDGGRNLGLYANTTSNLSWGVLARNKGTSSSAATGGALRAEGQNNMAIFADTFTSVTDVPAITALGGDGEFHGTALVAGGASYFDGEAKALRNYVGVLGAGASPGQSILQYAPVVSGEADYHTVTDAVTLDGSGALTVDLANDWTKRYAPFLVAVDMATLRIALTAVGAAMPNLHAVWTPSSAATTFGIAGGAAGGTVHFTITATRVQVTLADVAGLAASGSAPVAPAAPSDGTTRQATRAVAATARVARTVRARRR